MKSPPFRHTTTHAAESSSADHYAGPSKSQLKREMLALQDLGEHLAGLPSHRIDVLDIPSILRDALRDLQRIHAHEGRRRHVQYIGKLMRKVDPEPLRKALLDATGENREAVAHMHLLEDWRTRLLQGDEALTAFMQEYPHADAQALRQLVRATRVEQATNKPPRQYRALFQTLKALLAPQDQHANAADL
jgi:ribosome-associated protein